MVGSPKHLSDLAKIEADVRVTCRRCRFEVDWRREDLAQHLREIGASLVWSEITRHMLCGRPGCGSPDLRAVPVPYARRAANLTRQIGKLDERLIETALRILGEAVAGSAGQSVATIEVRLALLVLHRYVRNGVLIRQFWERTTLARRTVDDGLSGPLEGIRTSLRRAGWLAPTSEPAQVRFWLWSSPAPPGWFVQPGGVHEHATGQDQSVVAAAEPPDL
jgi:hypothetical protein